MKQFISITAMSLLISISALATNGNTIPGDENFNLGGSKKGLTVMPNPATGDAQILFVSGKSVKAFIKVFDTNGNLVLNQDNELAVGKNKININNFTKLEEGNYTIQLIANNKIYTSTFVMWKQQ